MGYIYCVKQKINFFIFKKNYDNNIYVTNYMHSSCTLEMM